MTKHSLYLLLTLLCLWSCSDTLDVDIDEGPVRLVIEGRIALDKDNPNGYQSIRLTTTAPYFGNQPTPAALGAEVSVTAVRTGETFAFQASANVPGLYETNNFMASTGEMYRLDVLYEGNRYQALETLMPVADIDVLDQFFEEETIFADEGIKLSLTYTDPAGESNFYHWQIYRNDTLLVTASVGNQFNLISSDEFYDGLTVANFEPVNEFSYLPGDKAEVRQFALTELSYEFYRTYYEQVVGIAPGFADVVPATLRGNVQNVTDPDLYPLGYFEASEVSVRQLEIQ